MGGMRRERERQSVRCPGPARRCRRRARPAAALQYFDARNPPAKPSPGSGPWQGKCGLPNTAERGEAEAFFYSMGFAPEQLRWDEGGGLRVEVGVGESASLTISYHGSWTKSASHVENHHPGFLTDPETGEDVWWNIVHTGNLRAGDGTPFPPELVAEVQERGWEATYALKLRPGDWLVLDNLRLQHGRLPYVEDERQKRVLLTVYDTPVRSCPGAGPDAPALAPKPAQ